MMPLTRAHNDNYVLFKKSRPAGHNIEKYQNICAIGGGTGLGRLLDALSPFKVSCTGIVATSDNGGSTGWLRQQTNAIAWGDIRNCLNQMSPKDSIQGALFQYRFSEFEALENQNLGNLLLYALNQLSSRPLDAINHARQILNIKTALIPMSEQPVQLAAHNDDDITLTGEVAIDQLSCSPKDLWLNPAPTATPEAVTAIKQADLIILAPGSVFTSLMPNLLVRELLLAIIESDAPVILVANMQAIDDALGTMTLNQQCRWMETELGTNIIDAIIWPKSRDQHDCTSIQTLVTDLRDKNFPLRHNKKKLVAAIDSALEWF